MNKEVPTKSIISIGNVQFDRSEGLFAMVHKINNLYGNVNVIRYSITFDKVDWKEEENKVYEQEY